MRILVTNDDGIDSIGLHVLARSMKPHGDVTVAAPDREYSGAGAAVGALHLLQPEARRVSIDGIDDAWSITGPPALCVMFATLGLFGEPFDLVVSGINPGANVGRSVYHSGTVGAALTARSRGISGVAVSQAVNGLGVEGQGWDEMLVGQQWQTAADVASVVVGGVLAEELTEPIVLNVNVPNVPVDQIAGWRRTEVALLPQRAMAVASMERKVGHEDAFAIRMTWGAAVELPITTDVGAVDAGEVSVSYLTRLQAEAVDSLTGAELRLDQWLADRRSP